MPSLSLAWARVAPGDTVYYVEPGGSNNNNGLTEDTPFDTIQYAIDECTNNGEYYTIYIKGGETYVPEQEGSYDDDRWFIVSNKSNITIAPTPGTGTPTLDGEGKWPRNEDMDEPTTIAALLWIVDSQDIIIRGLDIYRSGQIGIYVHESESFGTTSDILIEDCVVNDTWAHGIMVQGLKWNKEDLTTTQPTDITIRYNEIKKACRANDESDPQPNPEGEALRIGNTNNFWVYGNHVHDFYKEGIDVTIQSEYGWVYENLVGKRNEDSAYGDGTGSHIYIDGAHGTGVRHIDVYMNPNGSFEVDVEKHTPNEFVEMAA